MQKVIEISDNPGREEPEPAFKVIHLYFTKYLFDLSVSAGIPGFGVV